MNAYTPARLFGIMPDDVVLVVLPLFHVFGLETQLNCCLRFGATMSLLPRFDPATAFEVIQRDRVTIFEGVRPCTPHCSTTRTSASYDLSSLRVGISGGACHPARRPRRLRAQVRDRHPGGVRPDGDRFHHHA